MAKRKRLTAANPDYLGTAAEAPAPRIAPEPRSSSLPPIAQVAGEVSASAALGELSRAMEEARAGGRLVQAIPLDQIDPGHLVRDRIEAEEEELRTLMESLRARGQQTPIELVDRGESAAPRYGLISGWRRLAALKRLAEEEDRFGTVLALIRAPKTASDAYVAMVEENEIRVGLSYYERARIVVKSVEQGVFDDRRTALRTLFANVSRAKRSKIGSFTRIVEALDGALRFPSAIGERTGLDLARRLDEDPGLAERLKGELRKTPAPDAEGELARLEASTPAARPKAPKQERSPARSRDADGETAGARHIETIYDPGRGVLTLKGPGVDGDLHAALQRWLEDRA